MPMKPAPIALFAFNRPEHTRRALESLASNSLAGQSELFIFCDGPRRSEEQVAIARVKEIATSAQWCGKVHLISQESNLGCAESVIRGVNKLCAYQDRVIVLEDDLVISPCFLEYMNDALERYADQPQVMQITGYMFPVNAELNADAHFLPFTSSWGWATWPRAWEFFDKNMIGYQALASNPPLRKRFDLDSAYPYFDLLTAQREHKIDSWAIRWYLGTFLAGGLTLFPRRSLVENIGFDGSGTHCHKQDRNDVIDRSFRVATFPDTVSQNNDLLANIETFLRKTVPNQQKTLASRFRQWLS